MTSHHPDAFAELNALFEFGGRLARTLASGVDDHPNCGARAGRRLGSKRGKSDSLTRFDPLRLAHRFSYGH
jgi:hypothetical protein